MIGEISDDGSTLTWVNGTSNFYGSTQLMTDVPWHRCELLPQKCTGETVRYASTREAPISSYTPPMILPHQISADAKYHMLLVANRRYHVDIVAGQVRHLEQVAVSLGNSLRPGEWIEVSRCAR